MRITSVIAAILNKIDPDFQRYSLGDELKLSQDNGLLVITASITADATAGLSVTIPCDCELLYVIVQARATSGSGSVTVRKATTAITNAIEMATDTNITVVGTIDDAQSSLLTTDNINVKTNGANDRGLVALLCKRA